MWDIVIYLGLAFLLPFLGVVAGAHYERWMRRRRNPRVLDHGGR
jgi:hypothetical protein